MLLLCSNNSALHFCSVKAMEGAWQKNRYGGSRFHDRRPVMVLVRRALDNAGPCVFCGSCATARLRFARSNPVVNRCLPLCSMAVLKDLRELHLVEQSEDGYVLTKWGAELGRQLARLDQWSEKWAADLDHKRTQMTRIHVRRYTNFRL